MTEHTTVGIDIAKDTFDVFISPDGLFLHLDNTPHGHQQLLDALASRIVVRIVMEATGRYHNLLAATLELAGLPVAVVNPAQVKHFARALGTLFKTDPNDARIICEFGRRMTPAVRPAPDEQTQRLAIDRRAHV